AGGVPARDGAEGGAAGGAGVIGDAKGAACTACGAGPGTGAAAPAGPKATAAGPPAARAPWRAANSSTSARVTRPLGPVPAMAARSSPHAAANRRATGVARTFSPAGGAAWALLVPGPGPTPGEAPPAEAPPG